MEPTFNELKIATKADFGVLVADLCFVHGKLQQANERSERIDVLLDQYKEKKKAVLEAYDKAHDVARAISARSQLKLNQSP